MFEVLKDQISQELFIKFLEKGNKRNNDNSIILNKNFLNIEDNCDMKHRRSYSSLIDKFNYNEDFNENILKNLSLNSDRNKKELNRGYSQSGNFKENNKLINDISFYSQRKSSSCKKINFDYKLDLMPKSLLFEIQDEINNLKISQLKMEKNSMNISESNKSRYYDDSEYDYNYEKNTLNINHINNEKENPSLLKNSYFDYNLYYRQLCKEKSTKLRKNFTPHVITRWYRSPEIILIEPIYSSAVDIWSLGCIFAEILSKLPGNNVFGPLFPGKYCHPLSPYIIENEEKTIIDLNNDDQLISILSIHGNPSEKDTEFISNFDAINYLKSFPRYEKKELKNLFNNIDSGSLEILKKMLEFNPYRRTNTRLILDTTYFDDVKILIENYDKKNIENNSKKGNYRSKFINQFCGNENYKEENRCDCDKNFNLDKEKLMIINIFDTDKFNPSFDELADLFRKEYYDFKNDKKRLLNQINQASN